MLPEPASVARTNRHFSETGISLTFSLIAISSHILAHFFARVNRYNPHKSEQYVDGVLRFAYIAAWLHKSACLHRGVWECIIYHKERSDTMENKNVITEKVTAILSTNACAELKEAASRWLNASGAGGEAQATADLIAELREDIAPIDGAIAFFASDKCRQLLGAEKAAAMLKHGQDIKAAGAKYCDCPGCAAALEALKALGEEA